MRLLGFLDAPSLARVLAGAHAYVMPSLAENSSNSLCEAQTVGVPCVAAAAGGTPSLVDDERTGLLYAAGDAGALAEQLERVLGDDLLATRLGSAGRGEALLRHARRRVVGELLAAYRSILRLTEAADGVPEGRECRHETRERGQPAPPRRGGLRPVPSAPGHRRGAPPRPLVGHRARGGRALPGHADAAPAARLPDPVGAGSEFRSARWSNQVGLDRPCMLSTLAEGAAIVLGRGVGMSGTVLGAARGITLGDGVLCGANCTITDTDWHALDAAERAAGARAPASPVVIEPGVWLSMNVTVLKGVTIGAGTVVAAGSVVSRSLPAGVIAAGSPAAPVRAQPPCAASPEARHGPCPLPPRGDGLHPASPSGHERHRHPAHVRKTAAAVRALGGEVSMLEVDPGGFRSPSAGPRPRPAPSRRCGRRAPTSSTSTGTSPPWRSCPRPGSWASRWSSSFTECTCHPGRAARRAPAPLPARRGGRVPGPAPGRPRRRPGPRHARPPRAGRRRRRAGDGPLPRTAHRRVLRPGHGPGPHPRARPGRPVAMYVGSTHAYQGLDLLAAAQRRLGHAFSFVLVLSRDAGEPEDAVARFGFDPECTVVLHPDDPARLPALLRAASVLVHARPDCPDNANVQSKLGLYLASGRPIAATDVGDYGPLLAPAAGAGSRAPTRCASPSPSPPPAPTPTSPWPRDGEPGPRAAPLRVRRERRPPHPHLRRAAAGRRGPEPSVLPRSTP